MTLRLTLQILRIPLLVVLLALLGPQLRTLQRAIARVDLATAGSAWVVVAVTALAFAVVALLGRPARHPPAVLAVEAVVAGLLGLVPPTAWIAWVGLEGLPSLTGIATGSVVVPVLALTWFAIVVTTGVRQVRWARETSDAGVDVDADRVA